MRKKFPFATLSPNGIGLEKSKTFEWVIPNKLGGYSSSTIVGLNTKRPHGLLVSGGADFERRLFLQRLDEEIVAGNSIIDLATNQYSAKEVSEGYRFMKKFEFSYDSVSFDYRAKGIYLSKHLTPAPDRNALIASYSVENNSDHDVEFRIKAFVNSRHPMALAEKKEGFEHRFFTSDMMGVSAEGGYVAFHSEEGEFQETHARARWQKLYYPDGSMEYAYCPAYLCIPLSPDESEAFKIKVAGYETEEETAAALKELIAGYEAKKRILSSGKGTSIFSLLNVADTFIVDVGSKKTVIAGYPCLRERGRDAMISLPGLTLINGRYRDAEKIFERFLNHASYQGVPSSFVEGKPEYEDIDTSLWLIDRLYQYLKYVGVESGKNFLHTYWWVLKDVIKAYGEKERSGVLEHSGGTWMGFERKNAVEVQALWYNALKVMGYFATLMDDPEKEEYEKTCARISESFMETYWNGKYLRDSEEDDALRPNQLIALYLDHTLVEEVEARKIMQALERDLLTPFGLRSLSPKDEGFDPRSPYNGCVWPWMLGPYVKVYAAIYGNRLRGRELLDQVFEKHISSGGLGTVSEFLEGDLPFTPAGCISHACSVAELLRAYFEDIMKKKPSNEKKLMIGL